MKRNWVRTAAVLALVVALPIAGWVVAGVHYEDAFEDFVDELRSDGVVVDPGSRPVSDVPDEENAAGPLARAFLAIRDPSNPWIDLSRLAQRIDGDLDSTPEEVEAAWSEVEGWVERATPYGEFLREAARRPVLALPANGLLEIGDGPPCHPSLVVSEALVYLEWRVRLALHRGAPFEAALQDVEVMWDLVDLLPRDSVFGLFNVVQFRRTSALSVERLARHGHAQLVRARFEARLAAAESAADPVAALEGEWATLIEGVRLLATTTGIEGAQRLLANDPLPSWSRGRVVFQRPQLFRDGLRALRRHQQSIEWLREDPATATARMHDQIFAAEDGAFRHRFRPLERTVVTTLRHRRWMVRQLRLTRVGLAALAFHEEHERGPASLDELAPLFPKGVPADATGRPFQYEPGVRIFGDTPSGETFAFELR